MATNLSAALQQDFFMAVDCKVATVVRFLDEGAGRDVNGIYCQLLGHTLLHDACMDGKAETVKMLLKRGANVHAKNLKGETPLHMVFSCSFNLDVVRLLLESGADPCAPNKDGASVFRCACARRVAPESLEQHKEAIRLLVRHGGDLHVPNRMGRTPFFDVDDPAIAALLIDEFGVDARALRDENGEGPLFSSVRGLIYSWAMTDFLVCSGAVDINSRNNAGQTVLHIAVRTSYDAHEIRFLLENGADTDAQDKLGWRPIHRACRSHASQSLMVLMDCGAALDEPLPPNFNGVSPEPAPPSLGAAIAGVFAEHLLRLSIRGEPLTPGTTWLRWLVSAMDKDASIAAYYEETQRKMLKSRGSLGLSSAPPLTREEMVQPLKDHAWEKRKHLVCCYFETRRRRKEQSAMQGTSESAEGANPA